MSNFITPILILLLLPIVAFSQVDKTKLSKKEIRKNRPAYIGVTLGARYSSFRDLATSPLIYSGFPLYAALSHHKLDSKKETSIGGSYSFGSYKNTFNNNITTSQVHTVSLYYTLLYRLNFLSKKRFNVKIGGTLNTVFNSRLNKSLANNGYGLELIPTLFGSIKITKDFSTKGGKDKKFLFIKYKTKPRVRDLAFTLNVGIVNSSYRNGYAYSFVHSLLLGELNVFYGYEFKIFSGFRLSTSLDYTFALKDKNKVQISYLWDAYTTGGQLDKLVVAHHTLKFTFLFNTNNK